MRIYRRRRKGIRVSYSSARAVLAAVLLLLAIGGLIHAFSPQPTAPSYSTPGATASP